MAIYLDVYEYEGRTFLRTWNAEAPDTVLESVERPPLRITEVPEETRSSDLRNHREIRAARVPEAAVEVLVVETTLATLVWMAAAGFCGLVVIVAPYFVGN